MAVFVQASSLSNVKSDFLVVLNQHAYIILKTLGFEAWRGKQTGETTLQDPRVLESNCSARHDSLVFAPIQCIVT